MACLKPFSTALSSLAGLLLLLSLPVNVHCHYRQSSSSSACQYLLSALGSEVVLPTNYQYQNLSEENWVQTAWASPTCILQLKTAQQVSLAVKHLVAHNISFAIRSGGHSPSPLAANINDGVLFDMSGFSAVDYQPSQGVAVVGTGLRWGDVYDQLDKDNVTVVGGRILEVGVGGLTLGSGLSYLSDLYGLVCDNVENFEVVLADGSIVNASAHSNSDLWWALKGGANNFGVVTRFALKTYPTGNVWGGQKVYSNDQLPAVIDAVLEYQSAPSKDPYANLIIQAFPLNDTIGIVVNLVYNKPLETPAAFAPFYSIPALADTTAIQPMTTYLGSQIPPDLPRLNWYATSFEVDATLFKQVEQIVTSAPELDTIRNLTAGSIAVGWQPISTSLVEAGKLRGGNALGLQSVNQTWLVIDIGWLYPEDDVVANAATQGLISRIEKASLAAGKHVDYIFMNDASKTQDVISHYGALSVAKLLAVQRRYDPRQVFQKLVPGGFKLPL
ncbi:putative FAD-binding oxidoreductase [Xylariaceae sp. FL0255]|nr:putative FAD-binding oxidoreductase [Xylariaceae sp. FL0255]